jgi:hypothetical protein
MTLNDGFELGHQCVWKAAKVPGTGGKYGVSFMPIMICLEDCPGSICTDVNAAVLTK